MEDLGLQALHRRVAGIDVHRMLHVVTVLIEQPDGTMQRQTREFGGFKRDCRVCHDDESEKRKKSGRARNAPKLDLLTRLFQMFGGDLTRIDSVDVTTALTVISETGADMSRFPSVAHFASWLGLCPGTKITGGKVMSGKTKRCANRAAQALRLATSAMRTSQSALGAYFRCLCARMDKPKAVTAAAQKIARLIYTLLTNGEEYTDQGQDYYKERYRKRVLWNLTRRAEKMGMRLVASEATI